MTEGDHQASYIITSAWSSSRDGSRRDSAHGSSVTDKSWISWPTSGTNQRQDSAFTSYRIAFRYPEIRKPDSWESTDRWVLRDCHAPGTKQNHHCCCRFIWQLNSLQLIRVFRAEFVAVALQKCKPRLYDCWISLLLESTSIVDLPALRTIEWLSAGFAAGVKRDEGRRGRRRRRWRRGCE